MLVIGFVFIPLYYKWKVYTAYEFIGKRFDGRTRLLTAGLFLIQRGLGGRHHDLRAQHHPQQGAALAAQLDLRVHRYAGDHLHHIRRRQGRGRDAQAADGRDVRRALRGLRIGGVVPARARIGFGESIALAVPWAK
jgi:hypothetical protein